MISDLERLLNALWERDTCDPKERFQWSATVDRLIQDAISQKPGLAREQFLDAVWPRYLAFRRAKRKPPTLPPKA